MMEMQGNATEIDERNLLQLDALLSHGYGLSPQLVMRSKGLSIEAKALYKWSRFGSQGRNGGKERSADTCRDRSDLQGP